MRRYYPLTRFTALDYFALSTFYEPGSLNERARQQGFEPARIPCAFCSHASILITLTYAIRMRLTTST